jgi:hypothetical protein
MRFISIYRPSMACAGKPPTQEQYELMGKFMAEAIKAGVLLATEGFGPQTDTDLKVKLANGTYSTTDGPFTEAKEVIGGFAIMQCKSREELLEWTHRFLALAGDGECEIHQLSEMSPIDQLKQHQL